LTRSEAWHVLDRGYRSEEVSKRWWMDLSFDQKLQDHCFMERFWRQP